MENAQAPSSGFRSLYISPPMTPRTLAMPLVEILQVIQNKILPIIVNTPKYVPTIVLHKSLNMETARQIISKYSKAY